MDLVETAHWAKEGDRLAAQGNYEDAIAAYNRALAREPLNGPVLYAKGVSLLLLRTYEGNLGALRCFEAARDAGYDTALLWYRLGSALGLLKRYQEALDASERAVAMDPNMAEAWNNVAAQLWRVGRDDEALLAADRALTLEKNMASAWYNNGIALFHLRRYEDALAAFEHTTALGPTSVWHWRMRAETLYRLRRHPQALAAFEQAIVLDPSNQTLWRRKGETLFKLWRFREVLKVAGKMRELREEPQRARDANMK